MKGSGVRHHHHRSVASSRISQKNGNMSERHRTSVSGGDDEDEDPCEADVVVDQAASHTTTGSSSGSTTNFTFSLTVQASQTVTMNVAGSRARIEISDAKPAELSLEEEEEQDEQGSDRRLSLRDDDEDGSIPTRQDTMRKRLAVDYTDETERPGNRSYQADLMRHGTAFVRTTTSETQKDGILDHFLKCYTFQRLVHDTDDILTLSSTSALQMLVRALTKIGRTPENESDKAPRHRCLVKPPPRPQRKGTVVQQVKERRVARVVRQSERRDDDKDHNHGKNGTDTKPIVFCGSHRGNTNRDEPGNQAYVQAVASAACEYKTSDSAKRTLIIDAIFNQFEFRQSVKGKWQAVSSDAWVQHKIYKALVGSSVFDASAKSSLAINKAIHSTGQKGRSSNQQHFPGTVAAKQVVQCGSTSQNQPGNIAYLEHLASIHKTYRKMTNEADRESMVDSVLHSFEFHKDDQCADEQYSRKKIKRALSDIRYANSKYVSGEKKRKAAASSLSPRTKPRLAAADRVSELAAESTKAQNFPPMGAHTEQCPRLQYDLDIEANLTGRLVVYCASSGPKGPGIIAYTNLVRETRSKYKVASQAKRALLIQTFLERFDFQRVATSVNNSRMWVRAHDKWTLDKIHAALTDTRYHTTIVPNKRSLTSTTQLDRTTKEYVKDNQMEPVVNMAVVGQGELPDKRTNPNIKNASQVYDVHEVIVPVSPDKDSGEATCNTTEPNTPSPTSTTQLEGSTKEHVRDNQMEPVTNAVVVVRQWELTGTSTNPNIKNASQVYDGHEVIVPVSPDKGLGEATGNITEPNTPSPTSTIQLEETTKEYVRDNHMEPVTNAVFVVGGGQGELTDATTDPNVKNASQANDGHEIISPDRGSEEADASNQMEHVTNAVVVVVGGGQGELTGATTGPNVKNSCQTNDGHEIISPDRGSEEADASNQMGHVTNAVVVVDQGE